MEKLVTKNSMIENVMMEKLVIKNVVIESWWPKMWWPKVSDQKHGHWKPWQPKAMRLKHVGTKIYGDQILVVIKNCGN
jgi:hypothetical protein